VKPLGPIAYIITAGVTLMRDVGAAIAALNAFVAVQGVESLPLRMRERDKNALVVAA
jgi:O-acetylhomoserine (thiol)-lyase